MSERGKSVAEQVHGHPLEHALDANRNITPVCCVKNTTFLQTDWGSEEAFNDAMIQLWSDHNGVGLPQLVRNEQRLGYTIPET